jgi:hypothetical protein
VERRTSRGPGCWIWRGYRNAFGYGRVWFRYRRAYPHRVAWELQHGPIPEGLSVLHRCDNPACVRPSHLRLGTQADNIRDCVAKGRHRHPDRDAMGRFCGSQSSTLARAA